LAAKGVLTPMDGAEKWGQDETDAASDGTMRRVIGREADMTEEGWMRTLCEKVEEVKDEQRNWRNSRMHSWIGCVGMEEC
jgi:hypothetical protein